ncbi:16S rRNA (guanine(527)-N(7))-methyltransferase RsmG [Alterisphingorhabdus coralli]|uniref:Ribosomal RNA small subunit methyltransferase G n=1 Tax=Alterisphingorhabdus coralli TaxID=3071408 RepID=A0AA97F9Z2_9SPHN|nr:16S rRNA (guanine(527)-N(7))-methyltransferase RsmG [Parasphingorhabdus sp. SCSIO 66989]WOE76708.1 16S rRNA (guanine(527)-N(7))-methyltransferase RsmG [Parasphingorhabdus sp. SCSIO 66989]
MERLERYVAMLKAESEQQNLIARSTLETVWARHIVDSAQLLQHIPDDHRGPWLDLGSGPGLPGLVVAICTDMPAILVESRRKRVEFLQQVVDALDLANSVTIFGGRLEAMESCETGVITARAFAPLPKLLTLAGRFSTENTFWILPKGKNAVHELDALPRKWQKLFHVKHSLTDPDAGILCGQGKISA